MRSCSGDHNASGTATRYFCKQPGAKRNDQVNHLARALAHDNLFSVKQGECGVRRRLDVLNEIAVDDQRIAVEAGEFDHRGLALASVYRRRTTNIDWLAKSRTSTHAACQTPAFSIKALLPAPMKGVC